MRSIMCQCGLLIDKSHKWDSDLEQCVECTKDDHRRADVLAYIDTYHIGDLLWWVGTMYVLVEKHDGQGRWVLLDPRINQRRTFPIGKWISYGNVRELRETISKRSKNDHDELDK